MWPQDVPGPRDGTPHDNNMIGAAVYDEEVFATDVVRHVFTLCWRVC
jgi:hypothetical protein